MIRTLVVVAALLVLAVLLFSLPIGAVPSVDKKVTICHFPPGNPANVQIITISVNALDTHVRLHGDYVLPGTGFCDAEGSPIP